MLSMSFNNKSKDWIYLLEGRSKSPYFPLERQFQQTKTGHRLKNTKRGLLHISQPIGFVANGKSTLELEDELADWLVTQDWATLKFDNEPGRSYQAVVQNSMDDFRRFAYLREGTINFVANVAEGKEHTLNITSTSKMFEVKGQVETPWRSKTVFDANASKYTLNLVDGITIILNYEFKSGDTLKLDAHKRKVTLNDIDLAVSVSLVTDWGKGVMSVGYLSGEASHATTLYYTERFN